MSASAARTSRRSRRLCHQCQDHRALYQYRGLVRAGRHHTLCFQCYRSERERRRAANLADRLAMLDALPAPAARHAPLTPREVDHRRRMLAHLAR